MYGILLKRQPHSGYNERIIGDKTHYLIGLLCCTLLCQCELNCFPHPLPSFSGFPLYRILGKTNKTCSFRPINLTVLIAYLKSKLSRFSVLQRHYTTEMISDSHGNVHGDSTLLACYRRVTDVSQDLCASILKSKQSGMLDPNNDGTRFSETSAIIYQSARRNIPQALNLQVTKVCNYIALFFLA